MRSLPTLPIAGHAFDRLAAVLCAGLFALLVLGLGTAVHGAQGALTLGLIALALVCGALLLHAARSATLRRCWPWTCSSGRCLRCLPHRDLRIQCPGPTFVAAVSVAGGAGP
jgi:hypothetical protein